MVGDINPEVVDVYRAIKEDPHAVADVLESIPQTSDAFYVLRKTQPIELDLAHRAARLIFLMKSCFNGVYRTNLRGEFNVPMGNRVYALPSREILLSTQRQLRGTSLVSGDFRTTLARSRPGDWIYMDPPYRQAGRYRGEYGYGNEFAQGKLAEFVKVARELTAKGRFITISYAHDEDLISALPGWAVHRVVAARTVAGKQAVRGLVPELILTNYTQYGPV